MSKTITRIKVRKEDIDRMGHMNNSKYVEYMTVGRNDWYKEAGSPFDSLLEQGLGRVVVNININFRKEVLVDDVISIKTYPLCYGNSSFVLKQEIFNEKGEMVSDAKVTNVILDQKTRLSTKIPQKILSFLQQFSLIRGNTTLKSSYQRTESE